MTLRKREPGPLDLLERFWGPVVLGRDDLIRVDEFHQDGELVIRAELPGIDPDQDVELTVADGMLHIRAERREEEKVEEEGYVRRELRTGTFSRTLTLPAGTTDADITATYKDGILEVHVPVPKPAPAAKVAITKG